MTRRGLFASPLAALGLRRPRRPNYIVVRWVDAAAGLGPGEAVELIPGRPGHVITLLSVTAQSIVVRDDEVPRA